MIPVASPFVFVYQIRQHHQEMQRFNSSSADGILNRVISNLSKAAINVANVLKDEKSVTEISEGVAKQKAKKEAKLVEIQKALQKQKELYRSGVIGGLLTVALSVALFVTGIFPLAVAFTIPYALYTFLSLNSYWQASKEVNRAQSHLSSYQPA